MLDKNLCREILEVALETGGDFAEIYAENAKINVVSLSSDKIDDATYTNSVGVGVRVMYKTQSAYAYTSGIEKEDLIKTARAAAAGVKGDASEKVQEFTEKNYGTAPKIPASEVDNLYRIGIMKDASFAAKNYAKEISQVSVVIKDEDKDILVVNSQGVYAKDRRAYTRIIIGAVATKGGEAQTGRMSPGFGKGYECFDEIDVKELGREAAKTAVTMLYAKECPAGVFPVVIDGGFGGVIFHEACGHSLEATAVAKGNSEFCGKLGQKIAADCVSAIDDGTMEGEWGSVGMDDEGNATRKRVLIENGILKSYMIDKLGARLMGCEHTASSRRQDYTYAPTSRMTNTFICEGTDDDEEMIKSMGAGLYAKSMGGGSVNPITGEFNFSVSEAYWVKDGKIECAVRGATLIGNGAEVLMKIDRVGTKMTMAAGVCGSLSGGVPTNVGQPRIRVSSMTVGGKGSMI